MFLEIYAERAQHELEDFRDEMNRLELNFKAAWSEADGSRYVADVVARMRKDAFKRFEGASDALRRSASEAYGRAMGRMRESAVTAYGTAPSDEALRAIEGVRMRPSIDPAEVEAVAMGACKGNAQALAALNAVAAEKRVAPNAPVPSLSQLLDSIDKERERKERSIAAYLRTDLASGPEYSVESCYMPVEIGNLALRGHMEALKKAGVA